jgi:formylglycine-generating enzyme required for sulfatase activity
MAGVCETAPSCDLSNTDRTTCQNGQSCCSSFRVPGGAFELFNGNEDDGFVAVPTQISEFYLDKYEVTVGRMRQFVTAYAQFKLTLGNGAGKSNHIPDDAGWDTDYDPELPADTDGLVTQLKCPGTTWSDELTANNDLPANCTSFYVAYAFCIWDGGRLPTEAEWNFVAAAGAEQRAYPWQPPVEGPPIAPDYANYDNANPGPIAVGSKPLGAGRWGQSDLAGNVLEWTLDYFAEYPPACNNCLNSTAAPERSQRGGAYTVPADFLLSAFRTSLPPIGLRPTVGFRCARDLE